MRDRKLVGSRQRSLSSRFSLSRRERPLLAGKIAGYCRNKQARYACIPRSLSVSDNIKAKENCQSFVILSLDPYRL